VLQVQRYLHHNNRIILAGDAAHVHSPAGGQGMNTGLQDAANLAWKLSLVAAGQAAAEAQLLDTYQEERHPVGARVVRMTGGDG
jgi:2-polyprenyl-6-methoxyphenol hydroxylase-like FAD-dependent oxidoreductase